MKSLGWALIQYDYVPIKRRNLDAETYTEGEQHLRIRVTSHKPWNYPKLRDPTDRSFPDVFRGRAALLIPWPWTFSLQNCEPLCFCCWSCSVAVLVPAALANSSSRDSIPPLLGQLAKPSFSYSILQGDLKEILGKELGESAVVVLWIPLIPK